jgi:hypothetical protein
LVVWVDRFSHPLDTDRVLACAGSCAEGAQLFGFFLFSLVFFPAALIVAYLVRDRRR